MTKSRSAAHDGRTPQGGAEPTVEELLAWERSEFLVLVAYFRAVPRKLGTLLAACVQLSHDLLGNGYIRGAALRAKPRRGRGRLPADEAKRFQAQWCESLPRTLHSFLESDLPERFNRGELCRLHAVQTPAEARSPAHQFRWALEFDAEPTSGDQTLEPTLILSLGLDSLARPQREQLNLLTAEFFQSVSAHGDCFYGLADVGDYTEIRGGNYYAGRGPRGVRFQRLVNHAFWVHAGAQRQTCVRGVCWGNYLDRRKLRKLGGVRFLQEYHEAAMKHRRAPLIQRYGNGAALVTVCELPEMTSMNATSAQLGEEQNAAWLLGRFGAAGLLGS